MKTNLCDMLGIEHAIIAAPMGPDLTGADRAKAIALLDDLPALDDDARTALDPVLMILLSACCLQQRYFQ